MEACDCYRQLPHLFNRESIIKIFKHLTQYLSTATLPLKYCCATIVMKSYPSARQSRLIPLLFCWDVRGTGYLTAVQALLVRRRLWWS